VEEIIEEIGSSTSRVVAQERMFMLPPVSSMCITNHYLLLQESDGLDMPTLFSSTKDLLDDLNSMKEDPEAAQDALDINPQLASEFGQFSQITQTELSRKFILQIHQRPRAMLTIT
jgi:hypothetical protein